jgi:hypothetical protein
MTIPRTAEAIRGIVLVADAARDILRTACGAAFTVRRSPHGIHQRLHAALSHVRLDQ